MTLTEFLLARIAEDEAVAREASPGPWRGWLGWFHEDEGKNGPHDGQAVLDADGNDVVSEWATSVRNVMHIAFHDPARVLAECEAKRELISSIFHEFVHSTEGMERYHDHFLGVLAAAYSDHPDYQQEWKP